METVTLIINKNKIMKNYQSTTEGTWVELLPVQLTKQQHDLMRSTTASQEDKAELVDYIKSQREGQVEAEKANELTAFHNMVKPELKEGDIYQLISIDLSEKEDKFVGILNCRVNGEHKQIRF
jgi:hypothetical protein